MAAESRRIIHLVGTKATLDTGARQGLLAYESDNGLTVRYQWGPLLANTAYLARRDAAQTFTGTQTFAGTVNAQVGLQVAGTLRISSGGAGTLTSLTVSGLTAYRVPFVTTGGLLTDSNEFRYDARIITLDGSEPRLYLHGPATTGRLCSARTNNNNVWEWGAVGTGEQANQAWTLIAYNDSGLEIDRPIIVDRPANTNILFSRKLVLPAGTTTRAGLNIGGTGTAPTSPVDGDMWRVADQAYIRMGGNTREVLLSGPNQTIGGIKTFQGHIICATPSGGIASLVLPAGTTTLTSEGTTWNDSTRRALMTRINGLNQEVTTCMWQGVNLTAVSGTTFASMLSGGASSGTLTLPANTLAAGRVLRVKAVLLPTAGSVIPAMRISLGGVVVAQFGNFNALTNNSPYFVEIMLSAGAAPGAAVTVYGAGFILDNDGLATQNTTTSASIATNAAQAIAIEGTAGTGATMNLTIASIELL